MPRFSWLDEKTDVPLIGERVQQLEHFTTALADGVVDKDEIAKQEKAVVEAMKAVESELSDEAHQKITRVLVELTAYNIMHVLHELAAEMSGNVWSALICARRASSLED